jgi:septum formation protein
MSELILASASPRRVDLLRSIGVSFEVVPSGAEELHDPSFSAAALCELNAERKADHVARAYPGCVVLGADTLVTWERKLFGKPRDLTEAREMLRELGGRAHQVITGICLCDSRRKSRFSDVTQVRFKPLTPGIIEEYIAAVSVLDKAGAYGIQERGELLVESVSGSYSNVVGLPLERLAREFDAWGITYSRRNL